MGELIFEAQGVCYRYPGAPTDAVRDVTLRVRAGELIGIVGPNGSGKTTLLRLLLGVLAPTAGEIRLQGREIRHWKRRELARIVGVVAQREEPAFPMRVRHAVMFGRYPHLGPVGAPRPTDRAAVAAAIERCDVVALEHRWVGTLSGGEWQRVRVARALAQDPRVLVLDEPTANLDIRHEMEVFELVSDLVRREGLTGLFVTHHVNLAARFADRMVVMNKGEARAIGAPADVLTRDVLEAVFEWPVDMIDWKGVPQFVALRKATRT